ncbi:MAG TPA: ABC transporter ATP-binding protein [Chloroflexota bacterium]|nr:ABC transporter ATP-binding protein [Chloroflexota bacterium]
MIDLAIETTALTRDFGSLRAVDALSLAVPRGIIFGFLGPNGAGKTTTIQLLLGLLAPSGGSASVLGFDTRQQGGDIRQRAGALLEHAGLYERLTAEENLEFSGRVWHLPAVERRTRIHELLARMDLWERRRERVGTWSRGMKQKLAVARTLMHRPAVVFLDEPTDGLDPVAAASLRDDLDALSTQEGVTFFLTTHNLAEAERLCHDVAVIRAGKLLAVGRPDELRDRAGGQRVEIAGWNFSPQALAALEQRPEVASVERSDGTSFSEGTGQSQQRLLVRLGDGGSVPPLVTLLVQAGGLIEHVARQRATLEEAFLDLVRE